ncbi:MAG: glutamine synthetase III [Candidatus Omnitrophica bacterium]|nr:glutamine synthetase III [Candidatus Omnitrophota bacterium]MCG2703192.1 glutamine synthetase III [Candidatus Omnitrophota bacterium]
MAGVTEFFGELTFNKKIMEQKLSKEVFRKLLATLESGEPLDESIAGDVAHAMKEWAIENGATHFTHWFQPQRGGTAEKHDAFITYSKEGEIVERFSAKQLIQSEPDASSFPSGGMRSTFEARGYTAWDPTSPAFLLEAGDTKTLVIPSIFLSWTGEVLDVKTPLLRSLKAVNDAAIRLQRVLGNKKVTRIKMFGGPEQEYFLFSKELYASRPDLIICGRTLFGAAPAKGQQMEDHYFGSIKDNVIQFMEHLDKELYRRGIPAKTRHNEVSPNQFEIAPLYEEANLSIDHNLQLMDIMKKVAEEHEMVAVLHEKPLAGVNGSGKHFNWSLGDNTGDNYFEPSGDPVSNIIFLLSLGAMLFGVHKYGGLLRAAVADAGNDHRLGANEAPPAIISVYLGEYLDALMNEIEGLGKITDKKMSEIYVGVQNLPKVAKDTSDRNRTSPLAFTGNKFEFRAVGSSQNCADAATVLNLMMAYGYEEIASWIEAKKGKGDVKETAIAVLEEVLKETKRVRFEGNNYDEKWHKEAEKRGLPNTKTTPDALELFLKNDAMELFERFNVLSKKELHSKIDIKLEAYNKTKDIECKTVINIAKTLVLPAIIKQINILAAANSAVKAVGIKSSVVSADIKFLNKLYSEVKSGISGVEKAMVFCEKQVDVLKIAKAYASKGAAALNALRAAVDAAEEVVADEFWPMAKYQELLLVL